MIVRAIIALATAAHVGPGTYRPVFPASPAEKEMAVAAFRLDRTPVTNAQFGAFVATHPEWRHPKELLADETYLAGFEAARPNAPVVHVSWFAARAYCAWRGGRLPLEKEWELAAKEDDAKVLAWYAQRAPEQLPDVGGPPNEWGVSNMHGLVWEWIEDFSAALVEADSRTPDRKVFCGGAGASSRDPSAYATFMRIAFRSSLDARSTTGLLGFRCAYDEVP